MSFNIGSILKGIDIVGTAIDIAGKTLGLPEAVTAAAKVGVGAVTGNWMMAVSGGVELAGELIKNPPFKTEYHCASPHPGQTQGGGYAPGKTTGQPANNPLPNDYGTYYQHLQTLQANHSLFDGLYKADGSIDRTELQRMAGNPHADPKLREAAQFLLDNPHYLQRLDRKPTLPFCGPDQGITGFDLMLELIKVRADIDKYGLPTASQPGEPRPLPGNPGTPAPAPQRPLPPPGRPETSPIAPGGCIPGGGPDSIVNDPTLSIEQKMMLILQRIVEGTDDEMLEVMKQIEDVSGRNADVLAKGDKATDQDKANVKRSETTLQTLQMRLQELMERKKRMTELMSNLSMKFHEMARTAISNLGRA